MDSLLSHRAVGLPLATLLFGMACDARANRGRESVDVETGATLQLVAGLDDEGGIIARNSPRDTPRLAFFRDHVVFANARVVTDYLAPKTRVDAIAGTLRLDGADTGIPAQLRDSASFVPLQRLVNRFGAYARIEESPGRMATVWRRDVLCRYAGGADRRAAIFLEAAEQGLLRQCDPPITAEVRRWANASPNELWAAAITLQQPLDSARLSALLYEYGATPYTAYGVVAGHHLIVRAPPDSASFRVVTLLRQSAIDALERGLCGLPGALDRRNGSTVIRERGRSADPFRPERHMLASTLAMERELPLVRAGAAIVSGVDVVGRASELRRLSSDTQVRRFEPATKLDDGWVLQGADLTGGVTVPDEVAQLDSGALFARLGVEAGRLTNECGSRTR